MTKQVDLPNFDAIRKVARSQGFNLTILEQAISDCQTGDVHARAYLHGFLRNHDSVDMEAERQAERQAENAVTGFEVY